MLNKLRTAMARAEQVQLVPPGHQLVPVPIARADHRPVERMGYLDRQPDSPRPAFHFQPYLRTADQDIRAGWSRVAGHARTLVQNSGFLQYGVELSCAFTVGGDGLLPNVVPDAEALGWPQDFSDQWARHLERRFRDWSHDALACDARGQSKFGAIQSAALKGWFATGDILAAVEFRQKRGTSWKTSINLVDPVRLWTPPHGQMAMTHRATVKDGIEYAENGRPLAYHIRPIPGQNGTVRIPTFGRSGRRLMLHVFDAEAGAVRGISPLGAAIAAITQTQSVSDAAVLASHIAAMIVGVVTSDLPTDAVARAFGGDGADPLSAMMQARVQWHEGLKENNAHLSLGHGARIAHLSSGERFELLAAKQSFDAYEPILKVGLAEAARALGLAPEMLTGDKSEATYSSIRVAIAEAFAIINRRRKILVEPLCEFALCAVAEELIDKGELPFPKKDFASPLEAFRSLKGLACKSEWRGPAQPTPDELKTARAAVLRVQQGLSSLSEEIAADGGDAEATFKQRKADQDLLANLKVTLPWPDKGTTR